MKTTLSWLLGAVLVLSCAADNGGRSTGGETHFLTLCSESETCGDDLECVCGVCTLVCNEDATCDELPGAKCALLHEDERCASSQAANTCDVQCREDPDCHSLSPAHRCESGVCRARPHDDTRTSMPEANTDEEDSTADGSSVSEPDASAMDVTDSGAPRADAARMQDATIASMPDAAVCARSDVSSNEVLIIGDSFFATTHQITAYLEALAREAGALSMGEGYRDNSRLLDNTLALMGEGIADQYTTAAEESPVTVVIMNGGGADALLGTCEDASSDCPTLTNAADAAEILLAQMSADGVGQVVYAFYPDPIDESVREKVDALRPLVQEVCSNSPTPCHFLDLRPVFEGRYDDYVIADGRNPTDEGSEAAAGAIWELMRQQCIAQ